ncbi:MAG TPA: hypothetical protein VHE61_13155 [Opitutaceae bacterium]|nr:hypothetical protein [Opitutaceae bacterium]
MKNWILTLVFALAACAVSYGVFYAANREPAAVRAAARNGDAMQWLRVEFKLTDAQYAAIKQLHAQYGTVCAKHCAAIMAAQKSGAPAAEIASLENECVTSMTAHFHRVAALMSPEEGRRYLAIVLPRINDYDHRGAPNLEGHP